MPGTIRSLAIPDARRRPSPQGLVAGGVDAGGAGVAGAAAAGAGVGEAAGVAAACRPDFQLIAATSPCRA